MGLTKQYLRYRCGGVFNVIGSGRGGAVYVGNEVVAVATVGEVTIWDTRRKEKVRSLIVEGGVVNKKLEVTVMAANDPGTLLGVGYSDGSVRVWDTNTGDEEVTFTGHKTAVTSLNWDKAGLRLVTGARDTSVIVWDVVGECGVARLEGHKGPITQARFMETQNVVVSCSKDTFVKFWDLTTHHCFKTLTGHLGEVWDMVLVNQEQHLVTGGQDSELRVWSLQWGEKEATDEGDAKRVAVEEDDVKDALDDGSELKVSRLGSILRKGEGKIGSLRSDESGRVVACHGTDNLLEMFVICTKEEVEKRVAKRLKKEKKRTGEVMKEGETGEASLQEMVRRLAGYKAGGKVRSIDLVVEGDVVKGVMVLSNNMVEQVKSELSGHSDPPSLHSRLELMGHRSDVRSVAWSSDNTAVATGSSECVKVWNRQSLVAVRTMSSGYCLCLVFCPGDRHVVAGTKAGQIQMFELGSGDMTESIAAHTGEVWGIAPSPGNKGFVSGGADKTVKFWDYELVEDKDRGTKVLSALHRRTLSVDEGVTAVALSADGRLVAAALLDSTVKVFFVDTLKFFLSLYGHKLPVTTLDISGDSTLIVTGSADRNIKIWGLDFGDCHKSIFCHDDTVTGVKWMPDTHRIVTSGKDGEVKMWDGDTFVRIQTLSPGHVGEVWGVDVAPNGRWIVSSGKDRSVRLWEKTGEVLVLDDERETEREEMAEGEAGDRTAVPGEGAVALPTRRTAGTERGAEGLMEALELYRETINGEEKQLPPLMMAYGAETPLDYMVGAVSRIKSAELEEVLLVLPLDVVQHLVEVLESILQAGKEVEVASRCLLFLLEIHHGPIIASGEMEPTLSRVNTALRREVGGVRDLVGTNLAGLRHLADKLEEKQGVEMFTDSTTRQRERNKKKKKKEKALQRAVMAL